MTHPGSAEESREIRSCRHDRLLSVTGFDGMRTVEFLNGTGSLFASESVYSAMRVRERGSKKKKASLGHLRRNSSNGREVFVCVQRA